MLHVNSLMSECLLSQPISSFLCRVCGLVATAITSSSFEDSVLHDCCWHTATNFSLGRAEAGKSLCSLPHTRSLSRALEARDLANSCLGLWSVSGRASMVVPLCDFAKICTGLLCSWLNWWPCSNTTPLSLLVCES